MYERLKIAYVFEEERNPNKDLNNTFESLFDEFIDWEVDYYLMARHKKVDAVNNFIENELWGLLKDESENLKLLISQDGIIKDLVKYLLKMSRK